MTMNDLIAWINLPLIAAGFSVAGLAFWKVVSLASEGECSERMWLILGIAAAWFGNSLRQLYWTIWRFLDGGANDVVASRMEDTAYLVAFACAALVGFGALAHLRTFTWEWPWPEWMRIPWHAVQRVIEAMSRVLIRRRQRRLPPPA